MSVLLVGAAAAGLLGSPHCVGMCGGFATAAHRPGGGAAWHAGRLGAYTGLGAAAGALGAPLGGQGTLATVATVVLLTWFCARLAGFLPGFRVPIPGMLRVGSWLALQSGLPARFAFGVLAALLPCGLLWSAVALAATSGSPGMGALVMIAFGLTTVPALVVASAGLRRIAALRPWTRRAVAAGVLITGLWSISARASSDDRVPDCHHAP